MNRLPKHTKIQPEEQGVLISPSYSTRPGSTVDRDPRAPAAAARAPPVLVAQSSELRLIFSAYPHASNEVRFLLCVCECIDAMRNDYASSAPQES